MTSRCSTHDLQDMTYTTRTATHELRLNPTLRLQRYLHVEVPNTQGPPSVITSAADMAAHNTAHST